MVLGDESAARKNDSHSGSIALAGFGCWPSTRFFSDEEQERPDYGGTYDSRRSRP